MNRPMEENNYPEYGKVYRLWRGGMFLGEATFVDDPNIGDSFVRSISIDGVEAFEVVIADKWQEVKSEDYDNKEWN
jgi:hypothetical protein